jgi:hypothetical protein
VDKDYILAYTPGEVFIQMLPIITTASKAIAILWINFYSNKVQQLAQEAKKDEEEVRLPGYLKLYAATFNKGKAEWMPESRSYNHAIDLKEDFIQCEVHRTSACAGPQILTWTDFPLVLGEKLGQMSIILRFQILRSRDLSPIFGSDLP